MTDEPCQTCNDVPEVCASVPGLRHCEKANREATDPEDWYARYRREVEAAYAERDLLNVNRIPTPEEREAAWRRQLPRAIAYVRRLQKKTP